MRFPDVTWRLVCGLGIASFASLLTFLRRKGKRFRLHKNRYCAAGVRVLRWLSIGGRTFPSPSPWPHAPQTKYCIRMVWSAYTHSRQRRLPTYHPRILVHTRCTHKRSFQHFLSGAGRRSPSPSRRRFPSAFTAPLSSSVVARPREVRDLFLRSFIIVEGKPLARTHALPNLTPASTWPVPASRSPERLHSNLVRGKK